MRWTAKPRFDRRRIQRFAWFPILIDQEWLWMEPYWIEERWIGYWFRASIDAGKIPQGEQ